MRGLFYATPVTRLGETCGILICINWVRAVPDIFGCIAQSWAQLEEGSKKMKTLLTTLIAVPLLIGTLTIAIAADTGCVVKGWTDDSQGGHPVFVCPDIKR